MMISTITTHCPLTAIHIASKEETAVLLVSMISWAVFVATMKAVFLVIAEAAFLAAAKAAFSAIMQAASLASIRAAPSVAVG